MTMNHTHGNLISTELEVPIIFVVIIIIGGIKRIASVTEKIVPFMARSAGLEPATYALEVRCSIQLSYERLFYHQL